jgi:phosphomannomutase/phosphoglucomutase
LTPIGSTNLITRIEDLHEQDKSVPVAGEGNGGIFFPEYLLARDGAYTAARFLELLADRPASEVVAPYDGYHNVRINIPYDGDAEREALLDAAKREATQSDADTTTLDGYRIDYGDAWVLARPSGTEPMVRIYAEARNEARAEELATEMEGQLLAAKAEV